MKKYYYIKGGKSRILIIKGNVLKINDYMFYNKGIGEVVFPNNLLSIGDGAFERCNLKYVNIPKNIKGLYYRNFAHNYNLEDVDLNCNIETLGDFVFACCSLTKLDLPSSVKRIGKYAFWGNLDLTELNLNEGLEVLDDNALLGTKIKKLVIPSTIKYYGKNNNVLNRVYLYEDSYMSSLGIDKLKEMFGNDIEIVILPKNIITTDLKDRVAYRKRTKG